jgi:hypothetical protein
LKAPMVDRTVDRFSSQVESVGAGNGVGDRERPGETPNPFKHSFEALCHSSRVKAHSRVEAEPDHRVRLVLCREVLTPAGV